MTARFSLITENARGHSLMLRAIALALRGPRLQFGRYFPRPFGPCAIMEIAIIQSLF